MSDGGVIWTYYNGAYDQFVADSDVSIFNEKLVEQGVIERFAQIHGLTGVVPQFKQQVDEEFSRANPSKVYFAGGTNRAAQFARDGTAVFGTWI